MKQFSRRSALFSAAMIPAIAVSRPAQTGAADTVLVALGHRFDALAAQLDHAVEQIECETLEEFSRIEAQIVATPATTIEGLCVKARAGCWALLDDLDPDEQSTTDRRVGFSIMRDLIRLHEPSLQRPGALKRLVKEITENADAPRGGERVNMTLSGVGRNVRFWVVGSTGHKRTLSRFRKSSLSQPK